jgi:hypothetical protein
VLSKCLCGRWSDNGLECVACSTESGVVIPDGSEAEVFYLVYKRERDELERRLSKTQWRDIEP